MTETIVVIASEAKQSLALIEQDCFVVSLLAMTLFLLKIATGFQPSQ